MAYVDTMDEIVTDFSKTFWLVEIKDNPSSKLLACTAKWKSSQERKITFFTLVEGPNRIIDQLAVTHGDKYWCKSSLSFVQNSWGNDMYWFVQSEDHLRKLLKQYNCNG